MWLQLFRVYMHVAIIIIINKCVYLNVAEASDSLSFSISVSALWCVVIKCASMHNIYCIYFAYKCTNYYICCLRFVLPCLTSTGLFLVFAV